MEKLQIETENEKAENSPKGPLKNSVENLHNRVNRLSHLRNEGQKMGKYLLEVAKMPKEAELLLSCGSWLLFFLYKKTGECRLIKACWCKKHLLCAACAHIRAGKLLHLYTDRIMYVMSTEGKLRPYMLTLTLKNRKSLKSMYAHFSRTWKKVTQSMRNTRRGTAQKEFGKVRGYVLCLEVTMGKDGKWHLHAHAVILADQDLDEEAMRSEWFKASKDSNQIKLSPLQHPQDPVRDIVEVIKYTVKPGNLSHDQQIDVYKTLSGKQLLRSGGNLRGVKLPENWNEDALAEDMDYIQLIYRYAAGKGYEFYEMREGTERVDTKSFQTTRDGVHMQ